MSMWLRRLSLAGDWFVVLWGWGAGIYAMVAAFREWPLTPTWLVWLAVSSAFITTSQRFLHNMTSTTTD
jgi:membrane protein implicated in regulation of membrane protease activity